MSQGMDDKIRQISEMLNSNEAQEGIRQLLSSMNHSGDSTSARADSSSSEEPHPESGYTGNPVRQLPQDSDWIVKVQNILSQMGSIEDSRVNLLRSVHPFLNSTRKGRCTTCINILKVADILKALMNNNGGLL